MAVSCHHYFCWRPDLSDCLITSSIWQGWPQKKPTDRNSAETMARHERRSRLAGHELYSHFHTLCLSLRLRDVVHLLVCFIFNTKFVISQAAKHTPRQEYIRGRVLGWTKKFTQSHSLISPEFPGVKNWNLASIFAPFALESYSLHREI